MVASITRTKILKITNAFSKLTVDDLAVRVGLTGPEGLQEVLATLDQMVSYCSGIRFLSLTIRLQVGN